MRTPNTNPNYGARKNLNFRFSTIVLCLILIFLSLNSFYNSISSGLGYSYPENTFLFNPNDLFADYFKTTFTFIQNSGLIKDFKDLPNILKNYYLYNPYENTIIALNSGNLTGFHGTPTSQLFALFNAKLFEKINPIYVFILLVACAFIYIIKRAHDISIDKVDTIIFSTIAILSYPFIFFLSRGHFYSFFTILLIFEFMYCIKNNRAIIGMILLAFAVNIRFNAAIFFLFMLYPNIPIKHIIQNLFIFFTLILTIFIASLALAEYAYPLYNLQHFLKGIETYHRLYIINNQDYNFNSSLYGLLKYFFGYEKLLEVTPLLVTFILTLFSIYLRLRNRLNQTYFAYILCSIFALSTPIFGDYYLMIFLVPLIFLYLDSENCETTGCNLCILISCIALLSPKNYYIFGNTSFQMVINPLILVISTIYILYKTSRPMNSALEG